MSIALPVIIGIIGFFTFVIWLDHVLNENDDATTIGQFKKFQESFKGEK